MEKQQWTVRFDVHAAWRRKYPKATVPTPYLVRPENEQVRRHVDICLHMMTFVEIAGSVRERFGLRVGLGRCAIHAYYRDFWSRQFPRSRARGAARHRRGKIRSLESNPEIVPAMRKLTRCGKGHLIWQLLCLERGPDSVPSRPRVLRYVRRVIGGSAGGGLRPSEFEEDGGLVERIGQLIRLGSPRLIHQIVAIRFGEVAPCKPGTTSDYLKQIGLGGS